MGGGKVIEINDEAHWNSILADAKTQGKAVIVDFSATWCGPCQMIGPFFATLSEQFDNVIFVKVDVDKVEAVAASCGISAMPTFQVWKNGAKAKEFVGASKDKLKALCEEAPGL